MDISSLQFKDIINPLFLAHLNFNTLLTVLLSKAAIMLVKTKQLQQPTFFEKKTKNTHYTVVETTKYFVRIRGIYLL